MTLLDAAQEFLAATDSLHVVHPTTDVHGHGGVAGRAVTPHCAWECRAVDSRLTQVPGGGYQVIGTGRLVHEAAILRLTEARFALEVAIQEEAAE